MSDQDKPKDDQFGSLCSCDMIMKHPLEKEDQLPVVLLLVNRAQLVMLANGFLVLFEESNRSYTPD